MYILAQTVFVFIVMTIRYNITNGGTTKHNKKTSMRQPETSNKIYLIDNEGKNKRSLESNLELTHATEIREKRETSFEDPCYQSGLCAMNNDSAKAGCYCDDACVYFRDCCYDVVLETVDNMTISNLPNISLFRCVLNRDLPIIGHWMVTDCPSGYDNKFIASHCHVYGNALENVRVFGHNGIVYTNIHCAICNNVTDYQLATIHYDLSSCPIQTNYSARLLTNLQCADYKYLPPSDYQFRNCYIFHMTIPKANESTQCSIRQNPLAYSRGLLKNYYCGGASIVEVDETACFDILKDILHPDITPDSFPLTVQVTFKPPVIREASTCNDNTTIDSKMGSCMETVCYDGWKLSNGICESDPIIQNYTLTLKKSLQINQAIDREYLGRLSILLAFSFTTKSYQIYSIDMNFFIIQNANNEETETRGWLEMIIKIFNWLKVEEIADLKEKMDNISITYEEKDINTGLLKTTILETFNMNESNTEVFENINNEKFETVTYYKHYGHYIKSGLYFNVYDDGLCSDVFISANLVEDSVIIHDKNVSSLATFEIEGQILLVDTWSCNHSSPILQTTPGSNRYTSLQTILTYVCMGLSCIALILAIFTYKHLSLSDTIPGFNTLNVLVSVLLAHVFFLVGVGANDHDIICTCVGVLIHYFWLSHFAFMAITTIYMSLTFTKLSKRLSEITLKLKLTVFGYSMNLLFVVPSLVVEYVTDIPVGMGYNGTICFPIEYPADSISVPLSIVTSIFIFFNAFCLTLGVCYIYRQTDNEDLEDKNRMSYFLVYVRMFIVSGILWVFGIISALFPSPVLQTIFIVLLGLQGFLVSISATWKLIVYRSFSSSSFTDSPNRKSK